MSGASVSPLAWVELRASGAEESPVTEDLVHEARNRVSQRCEENRALLRQLEGVHGASDAALELRADLERDEQVLVSLDTTLLALRDGHSIAPQVAPVVVEHAPPVSGSEARWVQPRRDRPSRDPLAPQTRRNLGFVGAPPTAVALAAPRAPEERPPAIYDEPPLTKVLRWLPEVERRVLALRQQLVRAVDHETRRRVAEQLGEALQVRRLLHEVAEPAFALEVRRDVARQVSPDLSPDTNALPAANEVRNMPFGAKRVAELWEALRRLDDGLL